MAERIEPSTPMARPFLEIRPLLRALGIASDGKKLILAVLGLLALSSGWSLLALAFGPPDPPFLPIRLDWEFSASPDLSFNALGELGGVVAEPYRLVVTPFTSLFRAGTSARIWFESALMAVWGVAVWGIIGGAIARIAVVQASGDHRVGLVSSIKFALKKSLSLIGAPLTPLFAVGLFAAACAVFGLISRIPWGVGSTFAGVLGFVPILLGLVMALILIGLALGWPLMHATVAAEGEDAPDALSRSYSYVNQRLARYVVHTLASWVIGAIGLILVMAFSLVVLSLADWGVALGAGPGTPSDWGRTLWRGVVGLFVHAWVYSYFWSAASILYLILRRDVDGTTWHDVYLPEQEADTFAGDLDQPAPIKNEATPVG